jgi:hypothetical protein
MMAGEISMTRCCGINASRIHDFATLEMERVKGIEPSS